jgi:Na+/H+ antiporter NhaD/arsenite permease-like protein
MTRTNIPTDAANLRVAGAILAILFGFIVSAIRGLPQEGTGRIVAGSEHAAAEASADSSGHETKAEDSEESEIGRPPAWTGIPFVLLLGAIAVFPLISKLEHWWESNLHRFYVAGGLALLTLAYYCLVYSQPITGHWPAHYVVDAPAQSWNWTAARVVLENAILNEYVPFIILLFSLYSIAGGIRIEGDLRATPSTNTAMIGLGAVLASFLGTTGAAMLLIRPLLETNSQRKHVRHTVIFFIFVVCNCGGCLTPLGDPPLFLGYLKGVPFTWTFGLWREWLFVNASLLAVYYLWDRIWAFPTEERADMERDTTQTRRIKVLGLSVNGPLLLGVILSVALLDPSKTLPGTSWHPWLYLREAIQLGLVACSLAFGPASVRAANRFNFGAIIEVAALFVGIFVTMQPVLQILHVEGPKLGLNSPHAFFWITGSLSSVLDNAPTYLVFFETASTIGGKDLVAGVPATMLAAISLGAVFMGAMTYIGNGPNFMVKAIAEKSGVAMPSFFSYILYSVGILLPILILTTLLFL